MQYAFAANPTMTIAVVDKIAKTTKSKPSIVAFSFVFFSKQYNCQAKYAPKSVEYHICYDFSRLAMFAMRFGRYRWQIYEPSMSNFLRNYNDWKNGMAEMVDSGSESQRLRENDGIIENETQSTYSALVFMS